MRRNYKDGMGNHYDALADWRPQTEKDWDEWQAARRCARDRIKKLRPFDADELIEALGLAHDHRGAEVIG